MSSNGYQEGNGGVDEQNHGDGSEETKIGISETDIGNGYDENINSKNETLNSEASNRADGLKSAREKLSDTLNSSQDIPNGSSDIVIDGSDARNASRDFDGKSSTDREKSKKKKRKKKNEVVPVDDDIEETDVKVEEKAAPEPENKTAAGSELLQAVKQKNKKLALKFLQDGADVHFRDSVNCTVLHYAALAGFDDLVAQLLYKDCGIVKDYDENFETALHKAARGGHEMTIVILAAHGADVNGLNKDGRNPLELAVTGKHVAALEILCMFGADLLMQDWTWADDALKSKDKKDVAIIQLFQRQWNRLPGFTHGGIKHSVKRIDQDQDCEIKSLGIKILPKNIPTYYFHCSRLQVEFTDMKRIVKEDQELFSEIFECRTWGTKTTEITVEFKIAGLPKCNETLDIVSPLGNVGRIVATTKDEDKSRTEVKATITIKANTVTTFMFVTIKKPEVFAITDEAVTIQPQMEPDAEIAIPEDTFDEPGDLLFNVTETKDVAVEDDKDSKEEPVLLTNVLDLSMSNHQQPKQPIDMKLPMHSNTEEDADLVILSSSKEYPMEREDWEIVDAKKGRRRNLNVAAFQIRHFSIFTGVSKKKLETDFYAVTKLVQTALNNEKPVEFFAMAQTLNRKEHAVMLECALQKKKKKRKKFWDKKGFEIQEGTFGTNVTVNQMFRIQFGGNVKRVGSDQTESQQLMFHPNSDSFTVFNAEVVNEKDPPIGYLKVELVLEKNQEPIRVVESENCFKTKETFIPREPLVEYSELTIIPIHLTLPRQEVEHEEQQTTEDADNECTITALKMPSLLELAKRLDKDEAFYLATQLKAGNSQDLAELSIQYPRVDDFLRKVLLKWRGRRPYESLVNTLAKTLDNMGKSFEATELKLAHAENRFIRFP